MKKREKVFKNSKPNFGKPRRENITGHNFNKNSKSPGIQGEALKQTFGTMDFSTRNKLNHQIIQNLQNCSEVTLSELSEQHVDRSESKKMINEVFPPEEYGYEQLNSLKLTERNNPRSEEYYSEINALLSQYGSNMPTARDGGNKFQTELELQRAKEELQKLQVEIEENKLIEEEHLKLQAKVKEQRK